MSPTRKSSHSSKSSRPDVVIIGGGLSGLAAAVELASRGASVVLCEQAPRLGGRCYSYVDRKTGDVVDNGQHLLIGANHHVLNYLERTGARAHLRKRRETGLPLHHPVKGMTTFEIPSFRQPLRLARGILKKKPPDPSGPEEAHERCVRPERIRSALRESAGIGNGGAVVDGPRSIRGGKDLPLVSHRGFRDERFAREVICASFCARLETGVDGRTVRLIHPSAVCRTVGALRRWCLRVPERQKGGAAEKHPGQIARDQG